MNFLYCAKQKDCFEISKKVKVDNRFFFYWGSLDIGNIDELNPPAKTGEVSESDYNSYGGNAYGLANTLAQNAFLRPNLKSKKVKKLYFSGQLTVPGPGVPPAVVSGKLVADLIQNNEGSI